MKKEIHKYSLKILLLDIMNIKLSNSYKSFQTITLNLYTYLVEDLFHRFMALVWAPGLIGCSTVPPELSGRTEPGYPRCGVITHSEAYAFLSSHFLILYWCFQGSSPKQ